MYLPDDLYRAVKEGNLPASELLQEAVWRSFAVGVSTRRPTRYLAELVAEVGEPSPRERARAEAIVPSHPPPSARARGRLTGCSSSTPAG